MGGSRKIPGINQIIFSEKSVDGTPVSIINYNMSGV